MLNNFFLSKIVFIIVLTTLLGIKVKAKENPIARKMAIDSPEVDLIFPINDPLDPTNFH